MRKLQFNIKNEKQVDLEIYSGFRNRVQLLDFIERNGIPLEHMTVVFFMDAYYIVLYEDFDKQVIIGADVFWYRENGKFKQGQVGESFKLPYPINELKKRAFRHLQLADDLNAIDSLLSVYTFDGRGWKELTNYKYSKIYVILLGITFCETFFTRDEFFKYLGKYYDFEPYEQAFRNKEIVAINPFRGMVRYEDGNEKFYKFDYATYFPQQYYNRRR